MFTCLYWTHIVNSTRWKEFGFNNRFTLFWHLQFPPNGFCNCRSDLNNICTISLYKTGSVQLYSSDVYGMNHSPMRSCQIFTIFLKVTPEDTFSTFIFPSMITSGSGIEATKNHDGPPYFNFEIFFVFPKQLWFDLSSVEHPHTLVDFKQEALILLPLFFFQRFLYHNHVDWNVSMFQIFL